MIEGEDITVVLLFHASQKGLSRRNGTEFVLEHVTLAERAVDEQQCRLPAALGAVLACFLIRILGARYDLNAPKAPNPAQKDPPEPENESRGPGRRSPGTSCSRRPS